MRYWVVGFALLLVPVTAWSGPWPRERGEVFASVSVMTRGERQALWRGRFAELQSYASVYAEFGEPRRLTFGLDAGYGEEGGWSALVFARRTLSPPQARTKLALLIGAGATAAPGRPAEAQLQLGGALGRGLTLAGIEGWAGLDASVIWRTGRNDVVTKADLTLGLKPRPGWMTILQVQTAAYPGSPVSVRLAPALVRRLAPGRHIELGIDADLIGGGRVGVKLGTWMQF